jgi:hypothetical protein
LPVFKPNVRKRWGYGGWGRGNGRKIDVSNESHFSTSGGKRRQKKKE